jgi:hypothetical protein
VLPDAVITEAIHQVAQDAQLAMHVTHDIERPFEQRSDELGRCHAIRFASRSSDVDSTSMSLPSRGIE